MTAAAYTIPEVCEKFRISRTTLYVQIKSGRLKARKIGRKTLVLEPDLNTWLASLPFTDDSPMKSG